MSAFELEHLRSSFYSHSTQLVQLIQHLQENIRNDAKQGYISLQIVEDAFIELNGMATIMQSKAKKHFFDPFQSIPDEILLNIFLFIVDIYQLGKLLCTCKRFYNCIISSEVLWRKICLNHWESSNLSADLDLEWAIREGKKFENKVNYLWLAKCLAHCGKLGWAETENNVYSEEEENINGGIPDYLFISYFLDKYEYFYWLEIFIIIIEEEESKVSPCYIFGEISENDDKLIGFGIQLSAKNLWIGYHDQVFH